MSVSNAVVEAVLDRVLVKTPSEGHGSADVGWTDYAAEAMERQAGCANCEQIQKTHTPEIVGGLIGAAGLIWFLNSRK